MRQIYFILVISGLLGSCVPRKYFYYNEIRNNLENKRFSHIIIVGTGNSGTNLFLETLSDQLNKRLKQRKIETVYYHLGNNQAEASRQFNEIVSKGSYDAVLQFAQLDGTNDPIVIRSVGLSVPLRNGWQVDYSTDYRAVRFHQKYFMRYFALPDLEHSIVDVDLDVNMNFINPKDYSKLSDSIIRSLKIE